jgi:uncharacterized membrane protein
LNFYQSASTNSIPSFTNSIVSINTSFFFAFKSDEIVKNIRNAEQQTSGEVRIFVESRCRYVDPLDRAKEIFFQLGMDKTNQRNGTLLYVAVKDHQAAVFGDEGIHQKVGQKY